MPLPITIPNTFANATATIPLSQLDSNFTTLEVAVNSIGNGAFTLANAQITGGTISNVTLDNVSVDVETLSNVTITNLTVNGNATFTNAAVTANVATITTANITDANVTNMVTGNATITGGTINVASVIATDDVTVGDDLVFTGTGNRITGDFSNATVASRVMFQTSTGTFTDIGALAPSSSTQSSAWTAYLGNDPTNTSRTRMLTTSLDSRFEASITGTGTYLPMTFYTGGSERMRIDTSGNVGIGTSSPAQKFTLQASGNTYLLIEDTLANGYNAATLYKNTDRQFRVGCLGGIGGFTNGALIVYDETAAAYRMVISSTGEVIVGGVTDNGAYNLQCNGTGVWGAGAYVNGSDRRIKEDIAPLTSGLDVVIKLNPVTYRYKEDWSKDQSIQPGFIAQEMLVAMEGQDYVDGVVSQGGAAGYYSVAYQNIIPLLTKAIQEQQQMIETLQAEVAALKGA